MSQGCAADHLPGSLLNWSFCHFPTLCWFCSFCRDLCPIPRDWWPQTVTGCGFCSPRQSMGVNQPHGSLGGVPPQSLVQSRKAGITSALASSTLNNEELVRGGVRWA